jgi:hypothetical protein
MTTVGRLDVETPFASAVASAFTRLRLSALVRAGGRGAGAGAGAHLERLIVQIER